MCMESHNLKLCKEIQLGANAEKHDAKALNLVSALERRW